MVPLEREKVTPVKVLERARGSDHYLDTQITGFHRRAKEVYGSRLKLLNPNYPREERGSQRTIFEIAIFNQEGEKKTFFAPVFREIKQGGEGLGPIAINPDGSAYQYNEGDQTLSAMSIPDKGNLSYPLAASMDKTTVIHVYGPEEEAISEKADALADGRKILVIRRQFDSKDPKKRQVADSLKASLARTTVLAGNRELPPPLKRDTYNYT